MAVVQHTVVIKQQVAADKAAAEKVAKEEVELQRLAAHQIPLHIRILYHPFRIPHRDRDRNHHRDRDRNHHRRLLQVQVDLQVVSWLLVLHFCKYKLMILLLARPFPFLRKH